LLELELGLELVALVELVALGALVKLLTMVEIGESPFFFLLVLARLNFSAGAPFLLMFGVDVVVVVIWVGLL
jgi:hypothetical protein